MVGCEAFAPPRGGREGADDLKKSLGCLFLWNILLYAILAAIEAHLAAGSADVAVVGIGHLAWAVDDAAHDAYLQACQSLGNLLVSFAGLVKGILDALDGGRQVVERAAASGAGDELRLGRAQASGLQESVGHGDLVLRRLAERDAYRVADAIDEEGTYADS